MDIWELRIWHSRNKPTRNHKVAGSILALLSGLRSGIAVNCGSYRCSLDPVLLWLWCRPAATTQIRPLTWEPPYAMGADLKRQKIKNFKNLKNDSQHSCPYAPKEKENDVYPLRLQQHFCLFSLIFLCKLVELNGYFFPKSSSTSPFSMFSLNYSFSGTTFSAVFPPTHSQKE